MRSFKLVAFLLAVSASGAAAPPVHAAGWDLEGETLAGSEAISVGGAALALTGPKTGISVECKLVEGGGKIGKGGTDELKASYTKCTLAGAPACKVSEPLVLNGETELIHGSKGGYFERLKPLKTSETLATVVFKGEECALAEKSKLTGSVAVGLSPEESGTRTLKTSKAISEAAEIEGGKYELSFGGFKSTMTSEFALKLSGANSGVEWFRAVEPKLCKVAPVMGLCPAGETWEEGDQLWMDLERPIKFKIGFATFLCTETNVKGEIGTLNEDGSIWGPINAWDSTCIEGCTLEPDDETFPWELGFGARADGAGFVGFREVRVKITCGATVCNYADPTVYFRTFVGGSPAKAEAPLLSMSLQEGSGAECGLFAFFKGEGDTSVAFMFQTPESLYVTH